MIDLVDLLQTTGGALHGPAFDRRFSSFLYDSRLLSVPASAPGAETAPGPLFVAVKSETGDGHDYILDAVARGACGVLCQRPVDLAALGVTCVVVPDTRAALLAYAAFVLQSSNLTTVGITGSAGKTTTKELITAVLARGHRPVFHNQGSINGRYGLSIAAGELATQHEIAVLELAADSFDEIRDLAALTRPQVGVVTSVGEAHLATFASLATIAEEKGRLLEALPPDGLAVLNADDSHVLAMAGRTRAQVLTVGVHPAADLRIDSLLAHEAGLLCTFSDNRAWLARRLNEDALPPTRLTLRSRLLGRAGNGGRGWHAAEEGNDDIAHPLRHQFLVGLQADAGHIAGHRAAQQALHRAQRRDRQHRRNQATQVVPRDRAELQAIGQQQRLRDRADSWRRPTQRAVERRGQDDAQQ